jgi:hypothetical protein
MQTLQLLWSLALAAQLGLVLKLQFNWPVKV